MHSFFVWRMPDCRIVFLLSFQVDQFYYSATARSRGIKDITVGAILSGICGALAWLCVTAPDLTGFSLLWGLVFGIFALCGLVFLVGGVARVISDGMWEIIVNDDEVIWQAPAVAEHSFRYSLNDILRLERRIRIKQRQNGATKRKEKLFLCGSDGEQHRLTKQSGVNVGEFADVLTRLGVQTVEVNINR